MPHKLIVIVHIRAMGMEWCPGLAYTVTSKTQLFFDEFVLDTFHSYRIWWP